MKNIVLASSSPRRKELLEQIGLKFTVEPSEYPEEKITRRKLSPEALVRFFSRAKAEMIASRHPDSLILAADTIGVIDGAIIGKPESPDEARRMLRQLSGKTHLVITGFTILDTSTRHHITQTVKTEVTFNRLSQREIDAYVETGEPLDKAGAYAIQGAGAVLVKEIRGDYFNVMGLPLSAVARVLKRFGVKVL